MRELPHAVLHPASVKFRFQSLHLFSDINDSFEHICSLSFYADFFAAAHGPEAFFEIIVLRSAEPVHVTVSAMMVRNHQPPAGDDASCASEIQRNDSIGYGRAVRIRVVYLIGGELQSALLHFLFKGGVNGIYHPHAFIRNGILAAGQGSQYK